MNQVEVLGPRLAIPPVDHGCSSCGILWDEEILRRFPDPPRPPLGIHPAFTSPRLALCGLCLDRFRRYWLGNEDVPECYREREAVRRYRAEMEAKPCGS